jgi:hypothetical protein
LGKACRGCLDAAASWGEGERAESGGLAASDQACHERAELKPVRPTFSPFLAFCSIVLLRIPRLTTFPDYTVCSSPSFAPSFVRALLSFSLSRHLANAASTSTSTSPFPLLRYLVLSHNPISARPAYTCDALFSIPLPSYATRQRSKQPWREEQSTDDDSLCLMEGGFFELT